MPTSSRTSRTGSSRQSSSQPLFASSASHDFRKSSQVFPLSSRCRRPQLTDRHMPQTDDQIRAAHVGEVQPLNGRILLVDYDPRWAELFEREAARIRAVLSEALRIEHVGSTSVPGLPAKPILDI